VRRARCIAVDGPGSSGKGTAARGLARALGYQYVDTGAMYRAVALVARQQGVSWDDAPALARLAERLTFSFSWDEDLLRIVVDGRDVTRAIRADDIGLGASHVSRHPEVRAALLGLQRALGAAGGVVMDGRDIGTVVLPSADLKVFLDASVDERARRRHEELLRQGEAVHFSEVRDALERRDRQDRERPVAPLVPARDAVIVDTSDLTARQVVDRLLALVEGAADDSG
jgi:cytidylate kinase